jgi:multidrug efflux pump
MNDTPAVILNIQRQPGANIIAGGGPRQEAAAAAQGPCPPSVKVSILTDRTTTIRASVEDVQFELMLTVALVVMVIFLFLRNVRPPSSPASPCRCRWSAPSA